MNHRILARLSGAAAAFVLLTGAARDSAPNYYSHSEYYSDGTYATVVGGWLSCPPADGGYTYWGTWTPYEIHTEYDYEACPMAR